MPLVPLDFPPGVDRRGTKYQAKGRWWDTQLVRWLGGVLQPIGGWEKLQAGGSDINLGEPVKGAISWLSNLGGEWLALGTKNQCWVYSAGTLTDITPSGFTAGQDDATASGENYGDGAYGVGTYGEGDTSQVSVTPAQNWTFDNFGEYLVAVAKSDGLLYNWQLNTSNNLAQTTNAPSQNEAVVVTPERFLTALGAGGDPRKVQWADQESLTTWGATSTNQAGDFNLPGPGRIVNGKRARGETLIWTTNDLYAMRYIGGSLVYSFESVGSDCGPISPRSMEVVDAGRAFWMGPESFYVYDGYVQPLPSEVADYVFKDLNRLQKSKIHAVSQPAFHEVWWFYPSSTSTDIDRYVAYNYAEDFWFIGSLNRTAGVPRGVFDHPMMMDKNGAVYEHERGTNMKDPSGSTLTPYAESGPFEIQQGDRLAVVTSLIPDEETLGDVDIKLLSSLYPTSNETTHGPFTPENPTDVRFTGRQVRLRVEQDEPGWRVGRQRLQVRPGSRR